MTGCGFEHEDGAYVLGALSPEERVAFEKHLPGCAACASSVREIAGLPGLLSRVPPPGPEPEEPPLPLPDTLLPSLLRRVRARRRRRTVLAAGLVAAVTVVGLAVGFTLGQDEGDDSAGDGESTSQLTAPETAAAEQFAPVGNASISGWVSLTSVPWGTRLDLTCSYDAGGLYAQGDSRDYTMVITRRDGTTEEVATWSAGPGGTVRLSAATATPKADIARVVVRSGGDDLLALRPVSG